MSTAQPPLPPSTAARTTANTAPVWRRVALQLLRGAALVLVLNLAIAALLTATGLGAFGANLVVSMSIGAVCWLIIDGGRHAVALLRDRSRRARGMPTGRLGFPGWRWIIVLCLLGMALGPVVGNLLAARLTGHHIQGLWPFDGGGNRITWLLTLLASAAAVLTLSLFERLAQARADAEAARRMAAENQLKLLQSQLEPHMLFNTLANLRVLIGLDPPRAQLMLDQLIAFLRATLGASRSDSHSLATEFQRIGDYLGLMAVRMGPRLQSRLDLPEALRDLQVPPLLLQPLVENSLKHGLEPQVSGGRIEVQAARQGRQLVLSVRDSGIGFQAGASDRTGTRFGLQQVRERLAALYGDRASLLLMPGDGAGPEPGTLARISLPIEND